MNFIQSEYYANITNVVNALYLHTAGLHMLDLCCRGLNISAHTLGKVNNMLVP
jgi:hypothetical protein